MQSRDGIIDKMDVGASRGFEQELRAVFSEYSVSNTVESGGACIGINNPP